MKKKLKIALKVIFYVLLILLLLCLIINALSVTITGRCDKFVDDYNEFYLYKKDIIIRSWPSRSHGYKIWIKPFQKKKLLNKIKEDVKTELENMVQDNSDILKGYEISDDFKKVYVYYYKDARNYDLNRKSADRIDNLANKLGQKTVALKVELYHEFLSGYGNTSFDGSIVNFIEDDSVFEG